MPIDFQQSHFQNGHLAAIFDFAVARLQLQFGFERYFQTSGAYYLSVCIDRRAVILDDVQLQSTHYPLLTPPTWRGILVDHWSTISRWICDRSLFIPDVSASSPSSRNTTKTAMGSSHCPRHQRSFRVHPSTSRLQRSFCCYASSILTAMES